MINLDEEALVCDLAETYHIYDYRAMSCEKVGVLACGLRNNSRIMMKVSGTLMTVEQMFLAAIVDSTRTIAWLQSSDGMSGINRPISLLGKLLNEENGNDIVGFVSGQDFKDEWKRLTTGGR